MSKLRFESKEHQERLTTDKRWTQQYKFEEILDKFLNIC